MKQEELEWYTPDYHPAHHVAFRKCKGRKRRMDGYEMKALYNAMTPAQAEAEMKGVPLMYHGVVMGTLCTTEGHFVPAYLVFCYDGYKRIVSENDMVSLDGWLKEMKRKENK